MSKKIDLDEFAKSGTVDAREWAEAFVQRFYGLPVEHNVSGFDPEQSADVSDITGWFANAIENGKAAGAARIDPETADDAITVTSTLAINAVIKGADPEDLVDSVRTAAEWAAEHKEAAVAYLASLWFQAPPASLAEMKAAAVPAEEGDDAR